jgi:hypothetical protein
VRGFFGRVNLARLDRGLRRSLPHPDRALAAQAFDARFYLVRNPDVAAAGVDPLGHFLEFGWREGRDPTPDFSIDAYLAAFPEASATDINPFVHYLKAGKPRLLPADPPQGFRGEILERLEPVENRLKAVLTKSILLSQPEDLGNALQKSSTGLARLHITFSHDDFTAHMGGLQAALQREAASIATHGREHLHLFPVHPWPVVRTAAEPGALGVLWNGERLGVFSAATVAEALATTTTGTDSAGRSFAIHSLLGHTADETADILQAAGLSAGYFWLHDFASLCAGFHLLRNDVADCGAPSSDSAACEVCVYGPWRARHLTEHAKLFSRLKLTVAAPSEATLDFWCSRTSLPVAATALLPHATLHPRGVARAQVDRPFRLVYAGLPVAHKGWPLFQALAVRFFDDPRYEFIHLGARTAANLPIRFEQVIVGPSAPGAMQDALEGLDADAVLVWPLCRETFSYVAYEAAAAGCAIITGPDSGNVAAFVAEGDHGWVIADEAALMAAFESGEVCALSRARRRPMLYDLTYSALTADLSPQGGNT